MDVVQLAAQRIRTLVNADRRQEQLRKDPECWRRVCAALDALEDTQLAVRCYLDEVSPGPQSNGWSYLVVYGLLQALYVQQDAAIMLRQWSGLKEDLPDELRQSRNLRNISIGHPVESCRRTKSSTISRPSLSPYGFTLWVHESESDLEPGVVSQYEHINLPDTARRHTELMGDFLAEVIVAMVSEEREHRRKYRGISLEKMPPSNHLIEKVGEQRAQAGPALDTIREDVSRLRCVLEERGAGFKDMDYHFQRVDFSCTKLETALGGGIPEWTEFDHEAYVLLLTTALGQLRTCAQELDREYASDDIEATT